MTHGHRRAQRYDGHDQIQIAVAIYVATLQHRRLGYRSKDTPLFSELTAHKVRQLGTGRPSKRGRRFSSAQTAKSLV